MPNLISPQDPLAAPLTWAEKEADHVAPATAVWEFVVLKDGVQVDRYSTTPLPGDLPVGFRAEWLDGDNAEVVIAFSSKPFPES